MLTFHQVLDILEQGYGAQKWWPADTPFEVMVGAILTQNTSWTNVVRAIDNLQEHHALTPKRLLAVPQVQLAEWLRPSGYFNIKAQRLRNYCTWYQAQGGYESLQSLPTLVLRKALLTVNGVGCETADDILLYAFQRPVFVIDAYTRRLFRRLGLIGGDEGYEYLRAMVEGEMGHLDASTQRYNEFHALIVVHAKTRCRKQRSCHGCCLGSVCPSVEGE